MSGADRGSSSRELLRKGLRCGLPIGIGYFSVAFSFGIAAVSMGISWWEAVLISFTNLTPSGLFAGIGIIAASGSYLEMALTQLVINIRYTLMGISFSQKKAASFKGLKLLVLGHCITDEIFAVAMSTPGEIRAPFMAGLSVLPYIGWTGGTLAGAVCGNILPASVSDAMGVMIYGMFIAVIVPAAKKERPVLTVVLLAVLISCIIHFVPAFDFITDGFAIIICAVVASLIGAVLFPVRKEDDYAA